MKHYKNNLFDLSLIKQNENHINKQVMQNRFIKSLNFV